MADWRYDGKTCETIQSHRKKTKDSGFVWLHTHEAAPGRPRQEAVPEGRLAGRRL